MRVEQTTTSDDLKQYAAKFHNRFCFDKVDGFRGIGALLLFNPKPSVRLDFYWFSVLFGWLYDLPDGAVVEDDDAE